MALALALELEQALELLLTAVALPLASLEPSVAVVEAVAGAALEGPAVGGIAAARSSFAEISAPVVRLCPVPCTGPQVSLS